MNRRLLATALVALMVLPAASASHLPGLVASEEPDGGHTLRLTIDDGTGGTYEYVTVDVSANKDTAVALLRGTGNPQAGTIADVLDGVDEPITELGVYTHRWTHEAAPMTTVGLFVVEREQGLLRIPLVIFENVESTGHLVDELAEIALVDGTDMLGAALPFLLETALVELSNNFENYPGTGNVDSYEDKPTIYAWTTRKAEAGVTLWHGWYVERTGEHAGTHEGPGSFEGTKRVTVGTAVRMDGRTEHLAGAYLETTVTREQGEAEQEATWRLTAGIKSDQAEDTPLVSLLAEDHRRDGEGDLFVTPDEQDTRFTVGTWAQGAFVPLLALDTLVTHRPFACPIQPEEQPNKLTDCIEQTRLHSVGTFVDGQYVPVAGLRYHGERQPLVAWALNWAAGGGPGAQNVGDWELDVGTFVDGSFQPVAGVQYDDAFADARDTFQMMLSAGVYVLDTYQPVVATTYDGKRPMVVWAGAVINDDRETAERWMASSGTFVLDRYVPVLGIRYLPQASDGDREVQHQVAVGTYAAHYDYFVPLAGAQWDGDRGPVQWALAAALGGGLGAQVGQWDTSAGVFVLDSYHQLVTVRSRDGYQGTHDHASEQRIEVGTHDHEGRFVPLVGITYGGQAPLVQAIGDPTTMNDDQHWRLTAGVYVMGDFVPVLGVDHDGRSTRVTAAPSTY